LERLIAKRVCWNWSKHNVMYSGGFCSFEEKKRLVQRI
jgi:hypothetical protein